MSSNPKPESATDSKPSAGSATWRTRSRGDSAAPVQMLGRFEIIAALGKGAFGEVWKAYDPNLDREVALKIPRFEDNTGKEAERFFREARAAGQLKHPNIVAIHDAGQADGQYFIASTFIDGSPLSVWLKENQPTFSQTAEIVRKLAEALHYAHSQGIFHRDIKPANVMIDKSGEPHLMDFGLARRDDHEATMTTEGAILGTPSYMSPEQAKGQSKQADARSDLYSLGVVLYEMLAGKRPFDGPPPVVLHKVIHEEPESPRKTNPAVPLDLEVMALKCLAKEPDRRYPSVQHLADELRRWQNREPIQARAASKFEKAKLWCRRNPLVAGFGATAIAALLVGAGVAVLFGIEATNQAGVAKKNAQDADDERARAREEETKAQNERRNAQVIAASLALDRGLAFCEQGDVDRGLFWLVRALEILPPEMKDLEETIRANLADWRGQVRTLELVLRHGGPVTSAVMSLDGATILTAGGGQNSVRYWDAKTGQQMDRLLRLDSADQSGYSSNVNRVVLSPDGRFIATAANDKFARIWDFATGLPVGEPLQHETEVTAIDFSPAGDRLVTGETNGAVRQWDLATHKPLGVPGKRPFMAAAVKFGPDGKRAFSGHVNDNTCVWDFASAAPINTVLPASGYGITFSRDGTRGASGGTGNFNFGGRIVLFDPMTYKQLAPVIESPSTVQSVAFGFDGQTVVSGSRDGTVRFWDSRTGKSIDAPLQHRGTVNTVTFSSDGRHILTGSGDGTARLWEANARDVSRRHFAHPRLIRLAFSPDGKTIATGGSRDKSAKVWNAADGRLLHTLVHNAAVTMTAFSRDGKELWTGTNLLACWDLASGKPSPRVRINVDGAVNGSINTAAVPANPDIVVTDAGYNGIAIWNVASGTVQKIPAPAAGNLTGFSISPDDRYVFGASSGGTAFAIDVAAAKIVHRAPHDGSTLATAFSRDGKTAYTAMANTGVLRWDCVNPRFIDQPLQHPSWYPVMALSPDGTLLLTAGNDGIARLWHVATGKSIFRPFRVNGAITAAAVRPDGKAFLLGTNEGAWLFEVPSPVQGSIDRLRHWVQVITGKEMNESGVVNVLDANTWHKRRKLLDELGGPPIP